LLDQDDSVDYSVNGDIHDLAMFGKLVFYFLEFHGHDGLFPTSSDGIDPAVIARFHQRLLSEFGDKVDKFPGLRAMLTECAAPLLFFVGGGLCGRTTAFRAITILFLGL
jgi:hypothetical protein